jgi:hypothetical protein
MAESFGMVILGVFFLGWMLISLVSPFSQSCGLQVYFQVCSSLAFTVSGIFHFLGSVPVSLFSVFNSLLTKLKPQLQDSGFVPSHYAPAALQPFIFLHPLSLFFI